MQPRRTERVQVLVAGQSIPASAIRHNPQAYQQPLADARARYGSALCACQYPNLSLVIRERQGTFFLAAWPKEAAVHAVDCPFYTEVTTGAASYAPKAIAISDEEGRSSILLVHPLQQTNRHAEAPDDSAAGATSPRRTAREPAPAREKLHLWGLTHHLWEDAGLNRWHPGWHRDWGFVRNALRWAAKRTVVSGQPLLDSFYVPPFWKKERKQEINGHWTNFCAPLREHNRSTELVASGIVMGQVKSIEPTEFGYALKLHHHAERFFMDQNIADNLARFSRRGWAAIKFLTELPSPDEKPYVIGTLRVQATRTGRLVVVEGALMRVSPRFIPVDSSFEDQLARKLVNADREFVRPLRYDYHTLQIPDFILKDAAMDYAGEHPAQPGRGRDVAMHVYGKSIPGAQKDRMVAHDRAQAAHNGQFYWQWDLAVTQAVPPLPPQHPRMARAPFPQPAPFGEPT